MMDEPKKSQQTQESNVDKVERILSRFTGTDMEKAELNIALENLRTMELEHTLYFSAIQKEKFNNQLIEKIEKDSFWQESGQIVNAIKFSAGYIAEVKLNNKSNTLESANFEIRHTGKQYRHITPVAIIERIILNSLQIGANVDEILISLQDKIEVFKCTYTEKNNDYIQKIFIYFRHPDYKNANGISMLIKILGYLYNENILLSMNDNFIKIHDKLNDRYVIPLPKLIGLSKKHSHAKEGSFIRGLCNVLGDFEGEINAGKQLSEVQIKQITYAVFAMFDYLPLPQNTKESKKTKPDSKKHRYKSEAVERLYQVAASHLHFIFQAYPGFEKHRKSIFEGFLWYISDGVTLDALLKIFSCSNIEKLSIILNIQKNSIKDNFLNDGFALQYNQKANVFYILLQEKIEAILITYNNDYLFDIHPEYSAPETPMSTLKDDGINMLFQNFCFEYLYHFLFQKKNFGELNAQLELLKINGESFENSFKKNIIFYLQEDIKNNSPSKEFSEKLLVILNLPQNNFYITLFSHIEKNNSINLHKIIKLSIMNAYNTQTITQKASQEDLRIIRTKVMEMRSQESSVRKKRLSPLLCC